MKNVRSFLGVILDPLWHDILDLGLNQLSRTRFPEKIHFWRLSAAASVSVGGLLDTGGIALATEMSGSLLGPKKGPENVNFHGLYRRRRFLAIFGGDLLGTGGIALTTEE